VIVMKKKILEVVKITGFEYGAYGDAGTEYYMEFKVSGYIGPIAFFFGRNDNDKYVCGAAKFRSTKEVIEEMFYVDHLVTQNLNDETVRQAADQMAIAIGNPKITLRIQKRINDPGRVIDFLKLLILKKLELEHQPDLKKFMAECNEAADEMQGAWDSECELLDEW